MTEPWAYQPPPHRVALVGDAWDFVQERHTDGGPGPDGQPATVDETATAAAANEAPDEFDPNEHTVPEVNDYLERADESERERVLTAERDGQARKGIVGE